MSKMLGPSTAFMLTIASVFAQQVTTHEVWTLPSGTRIGELPSESGWNRSLTPDADGPIDSQRQESAGLVSLASLTRPLKGRSLQLIQNAQKQFDAQHSGEAVKLLRTALDDPSAKPYALLMLGTEHLKEVQAHPQLLPVAVEELQGGAAQLPDVASAHSNLALALWLKGETDEALKEAKRALQLDPNVAKSRYTLGAILLTVGQVEEARYHLKIAAVEIPGARQLLDSLLPE